MSNDDKLLQLYQDLSDPNEGRGPQIVIAFLIVIALFAIGLSFYSHTRNPIEPESSPFYTEPRRMISRWDQYESDGWMLAESDAQVTHPDCAAQPNPKLVFTPNPENQTVMLTVTNGSSTTSDMLQAELQPEGITYELIDSCAIQVAAVPGEMDESSGDQLTTEPVVVYRWGHVNADIPTVTPEDASTTTPDS
ncbi:MAG: hypothetical protein ACOCXQ_04325 [Patescibacteria group bacterium]